MPRSTQPLLTVAFFAWFAAWFVADRYVSADFYRFAVGEAAQLGLGWATVLVALALVVIPIINPHRQRTTRWRRALLFIAPVAIAEVLWRLVMNEAPWDFVKGLGIVLHVATPGLLALGCVAVIMEWRAHRSAVMPRLTGDHPTA